jgi:hypothetical protein
MMSASAVGLADAVLALHLLVIGFNVFGLIAIPLGAWRHWRFVRIAWWRWLHVAALAMVAVQALAGRACFLTLWQAALLANGAGAPPLIMHWVDQVIFWPLPLWVFAALYVVVWLYVLVLLWVVPPAWPRRRTTGSIGG